MSYTALYRKYRPDTFEDVKGQDHITTTLKNQIRADRIGHAYLFCGTRGTGKTTVAKVFAKAVNCQNPVDGAPCGECALCRAIDGGASMNVIEIDAASNNSVDNIRQIIEEVAYPPTEGRFKVYIIDEVHMLSTGAFNALLKTLEEPPSYVMFILATTEPHKIPLTILSRCQRYDFRRISNSVIADRLTELLAQEQIEAEEKAVRYIARMGDGSMRDALSLLDQCISFYIGQELTYEKVLDVLGTTDTEVFSRLLRAVIDDDAAAAIEIIGELILQGRELGQFVTDFIWYLRSVLLVQSAGEIEGFLDLSADNLSLLKEEAELLDPESVMRYIRVFSDLSAQLRYATQKRVLLEIAVIRLCKPAMENTQDALLDRIAQLERKVENGVKLNAEQLASLAGQTNIAGRAVAAPGAEGGTQKAEKKPQVVPKALPEDVKEAVRLWPEIIRSLAAPVRVILGQVRLSLSGENKLMLVFDGNMTYTGDTSYDLVAKEETRKEIEAAIENRIGKSVEVTFEKNENGQPFEQNFVDLGKILHMDVEIEE